MAWELRNMRGAVKFIDQKVQTNFDLKQPSNVSLLGEKLMNIWNDKNQ